MVSESMARKLFGRENPIGKPVYFSEFAGVSIDFPELMDIKMIVGRHFRPSDEAPDNTQAVCILSETAAREIASRFTTEELGDISEMIGTGKGNCRAESTGFDSPADLLDAELVFSPDCIYSFA